MYRLFVLETRKIVQIPVLNISYQPYLDWSAGKEKYLFTEGAVEAPSEKDS